MWKPAKQKNRKSVKKNTITLLTLILVVAAGRDGAR
jgi:hypothetical protein